jgi:hypothetical protein
MSMNLDGGSGGFRFAGSFGSTGLSADGTNSFATGGGGFGGGFGGAGTGFSTATGGSAVFYSSTGSTNVAQPAH